MISTTRTTTTPMRQPAAADRVSSEDLQRRSWRAFTRDHNEADASRLFTERYGRPPEYIIEAKGILLLGPVPAGGAQHDSEARS